MDWDTRLAVTVGTDIVSVIESFSPTFSTTYRVQHSLEKDNVGFVRQPFTFTFSMTVRALNTETNAVAKLTKLALEGTEFSITVARTTDSPGDQWAFDEVLFTRCFITSAAPSNLTLNDSPTATFSGICLGYSMTDSAEETVTNTG